MGNDAHAEFNLIVSYGFFIFVFISSSFFYIIYNTFVTPNSFTTVFASFGVSIKTVSCYMQHIDAFPVGFLHFTELLKAQYDFKLLSGAAKMVA